MVTDDSDQGASGTPNQSLHRVLHTLRVEGEPRLP